jgi:hypothetical protein
MKTSKIMSRFDSASMMDSLIGKARAEKLVARGIRGRKVARAMHDRHRRDDMRDISN